jgi:ribosomal protein L40E/TM2 domain-containing membrane protein YozV
MAEKEAKDPKPGKIFCFRCGAEIFEDAEICPKCGVRQNRNAGAVKTMPAQPAGSAGQSGASPPRGHVNSGLAIILSFFWPGLGHVYLGDIMFGLFVMVAYTVLWGIAVLTALICSPIPLIVWIWAMYDSNNLAKRINSGKVD